MHDPDTLVRFIHALRCGVLVLWFMIGMYSLPSFGRLALRQTISGDLISCVMMLLSVSLVTFQTAALGKGIEPPPDGLVAAGLVGLIATGISYYLVRCRSVPAEHKAAAIFAPFGILLVTLTAGALS